MAGDTLAVGRAVLESLRGLGAIASFDLVGLHALPSDWGAGCSRCCGTGGQENSAGGWPTGIRRPTLLLGPCCTP